jgi:hypothetical protein
MIEEVRGGIGDMLLGKFDTSVKADTYLGKDFLVSVCDLYIFDEDENLVLSSKSLMDCDINVNNAGGTIKVTDAVFSLGILKFTTGQKEEKKSDYQKMLNSNEKTEVVLSNKNNGKKCKVVAIAEVRNNMPESIVRKLRYGFPNCFIESKYSQLLKSNGVATTETTIYVEPDENGDVVKITL